MIYQLLDAKNNQVTSGSFLDCKQVEGNLRAMGQTGFVCCADYEAMGYVFYKSGGVGHGVVNEDFMLGFMLGFAEYPSCFKTFKQALEDFFLPEKVEQYLDLARRFKANQNQWVRWTNLPLS